jgi:hypothetical protein
MVTGHWRFEIASSPALAGLLAMTVCLAKCSSARLLDVIPIAKPLIGEDEINAVMAVLRSGVIAQGKKFIKVEYTCDKMWQVKTLLRLAE